MDQPTYTIHDLMLAVHKHNNLVLEHLICSTPTFIQQLQPSPFECVVTDQHTCRGRVMISHIWVGLDTLKVVHLCSGMFWRVRQAQRLRYPLDIAIRRLSKSRCSLRTVNAVSQCHVCSEHAAAIIIIGKTQCMNVCEWCQSYSGGELLIKILLLLSAVVEIPEIRTKIIMMIDA